MNRQLVLKQNGIRLIEILEENGYEGYFVGGCVRDMVMGREYSDIDIATSALPEDTRRIFSRMGLPVIDVGIKHGTVAVVYCDAVYEITSTSVREALVKLVK